MDDLGISRNGRAFPVTILPARATEGEGIKDNLVATVFVAEYVTVYMDSVRHD